VYRTPTSSHVRIHNSHWHGYDYVAPAGVFKILYGDINNNNGYAARVTVLNGASSDIRESQFIPLVLNSVPFNVYGLIRMCTTEKFMYIVDRVLLYYKYDYQGTIDCIKVTAVMLVSFCDNVQPVRIYEGRSISKLQNSAIPLTL